MSVPPPLRTWGCSGIVIFGGCVPPADVIVLPMNGGTSGLASMEAWSFAESPSGSPFTESEMPAAAAPGLALGPAATVTSLHASSHLKGSLTSPSPGKGFIREDTPEERAEYARVAGSLREFGKFRGGPRLAGAP